MRGRLFLFLFLLSIFGCKKKDSSNPHTQNCYVGKETIWSGNSRQRIYTFQTDPDGTLRYTTLQDTDGHILAKQTFSFTSNKLTGSVLNNGTMDIGKGIITLTGTGNIERVDFMEPDTSDIFRLVYSDIFEYNQVNKVSRFTTIYYSKKGADSVRLVNQYQYDAKGNVSSYTITDTAGQQLAQVQYTYDDKKNYLRDYLVTNDIATSFSENNITSFNYTDERTGLETTRNYDYQFNDKGYIVRSIMKQDGQKDVTTWYDYICY
jgi:hypothetical protein